MLDLKCTEYQSNTEERDQPSSLREGHGDCAEEADVCKAAKKSNTEWGCGWTEVQA